MLSSGHYQILTTLSRGGPRSRTELAKVLRISKASISSLVRDLLEQNILSEQELVFGVGRPSVSLAVRADAASFIGISLQQNPAILLLTDLHGSVRARIEIPREKDPQRSVESLAAAILELRRNGSDAAQRISGIGMALPGFVSRDRRTCITSTALGWRDVDIGAAISQRTKLPAWVENDANSLILGEELFGPLRGSPDFGMLFVSHGIGCAHIVNGRLLRGNTGGAGEISHAPIATDGFGALPCRCGNKGCLETIASIIAITNAARRAGLPEHIGQLAAMASRGESDALALLHRAGSALGLATAQLIQMLDPSHMIVMLDPALHDSVFTHALRNEAESHVLHRAGRGTMVTFRDFAPDNFASGAASLAARYFISGSDSV